MHLAVRLHQPTCHDHLAAVHSAHVLKTGGEVAGLRQSIFLLAQHHSLFASDHLSFVEQSYAGSGVGGVVLGQPVFLKVQHHSLFASDHLSFVEQLCASAALDGSGTGGALWKPIETSGLPASAHDAKVWKHAASITIHLAVGLHRPTCHDRLAAVHSAHVLKTGGEVSSLFSPSLFSIFGKKG